MTAQLTAFRAIDNALSLYYQRLGYSSYRNANGVGIFLQYVFDEELVDEDLPIEKELGDGCDPNDCAYSWMNNETKFPIPHYAVIMDYEQEAFIFYILQYCYKHGHPPSDQYIKDILLPKIGGTVPYHPPLFKSIEIPEIAKKESVHKEQEVNVIRVSQKEFKPKYPARAHLNIFTSKELTKELKDVIEEEFDNELILYYYTDINTGLQINDHQMTEFTLLMDGNECKLSIINYDLHIKGTGQCLYGVIVPNDNYKIQQDKWLWKLDGFLTAEQILTKYKIKQHELPQSSREMPRFQKQLSQTLVIEESLIDDTDWFTVQQIKSRKRNIKVPKTTVTLSKEMWMTECKKSFQNVDLPLIPVVVNKNNNHWIEWIKIINVESQNVYVGISCKYDEDNDKWSVQSICLDRGDIYNKHRLIGIKRDKYNEQLENFKTSIMEIKFSDNESKDIDKKINTLKEAFLRTQNANKFDTMLYDKDTFSDRISDDVIKIYDVLEFKTSPIGAKRNIYIDKQFTKAWMNYVTPKFNDEAMMYYWLDYTTAMQMCQGHSKQYVDKETKEFMVSIINYELMDSNNNVLYGIILYRDEQLKTKADKYPYKLVTFMTKEQILIEYGINEDDLPKRSRKNKDFTDKLLLQSIFI